MCQFQVFQKFVEQEAEQRENADKKVDEAKKSTTDDDTTEKESRKDSDDGTSEGGQDFLMETDSREDQGEGGSEQNEQDESDDRQLNTKQTEQEETDGDRVHNKLSEGAVNKERKRENEITSPRKSCDDALFSPIDQQEIVFDDGGDREESDEEEGQELDNGRGDESEDDDEEEEDYDDVSLPDIEFDNDDENELGDRSDSCSPDILEELKSKDETNTNQHVEEDGSDLEDEELVDDHKMNFDIVPCISRDKQCPVNNGVIRENTREIIEEATESIEANNENSLQIKDIPSSSASTNEKGNIDDVINENLVNLECIQSDRVPCDGTIDKTNSRTSSCEVDEEEAPSKSSTNLNTSGVDNSNDSLSPSVSHNSDGALSTPTKSNIYCDKKKLVSPSSRKLLSLGNKTKKSGEEADFSSVNNGEISPDPFVNEKVLIDTLSSIPQVEDGKCANNEHEATNVCPVNSVTSAKDNSCNKEESFPTVSKSSLLITTKSLPAQKPSSSEFPKAPTPRIKNRSLASRPKAGKLRSPVASNFNNRDDDLNNHSVIASPHTKAKHLSVNNDSDNDDCITLDDSPLKKQTSLLATSATSNGLSHGRSKGDFTNKRDEESHCTNDQFQFPDPLEVEEENFSEEGKF